MTVQMTETGHMGSQKLYGKIATVVDKLILFPLRLLHVQILSDNWQRWKYKTLCLALKDLTCFVDFNFYFILFKWHIRPIIFV